MYEGNISPCCEVADSESYRQDGNEYLAPLVYQHAQCSNSP